MSSFLRPRRGKKATAVAQLTASNPLKRGEIFFEVPDGGVGTGTGALKMGDGSTAYDQLPYFMKQPEVDYTNAVVAWSDTSAADSSPYTTNAGYIGNITPSASLKTILTNLKKLLLNYNSQLTLLNNDLGLKLDKSSISNWALSPTKPYYSYSELKNLPSIYENTLENLKPQQTHYINLNYSILGFISFKANGYKNNILFLSSYTDEKEGTNNSYILTIIGKSGTNAHLAKIYEWGGSLVFQNTTTTSNLNYTFENIRLFFIRL